MSNAGTGTPILVVLIGPPAVGKMTVGQELEHLTGFPLFHVHQVIDLALRYFPYSTTPRSPYRRLVEGYRALFFAEAACAGLSVITTAGWRFDLPTDTEAMHGYAPPFWRVAGAFTLPSCSQRWKRGWRATGPRTGAGTNALIGPPTMCCVRTTRTIATTAAARCRSIYRCCVWEPITSPRGRRRSVSVRTSRCRSPRGSVIAP